MIHTSYSPEKLRALRERAMLNQREVQDLTGIYQQTISDLENGKSRPQTATLRKLLALYEVRIRTYEQRDKEWSQHGNHTGEAVERH